MKKSKNRAVLVFATLVCGLTLSGCQTPLIRSIREVEPTPDETAEEIPVPTSLITFSETGFSPELAEVDLGTAVQFENIGRNSQIIASDPHPNHNYLPDLYTTPIYPKEKYSYTFKNPGRWGFHLEANPSIRGEVVVR
ncbi:MAG: hypothetical protein OEV37_00235 [Candidatus Berkelbacteria bacterium]|nr:hypothetical protein [Candidatus Berkelbacteria bacterium]